MNDDPITNRIVATTTLVEKISSSNLTKIIVAGFFSIFLYSMFEQRTVLIATLVSSPTIAIVFVALILMLLIAMGLNHIFQIQQARIDFLQHQIDEDHRKILDILGDKK